MATPDQIRRRGRWSLVLGALIAMAALSAVAFAGHTVNPTSLSFSATQGGTNPASQTFTFSGPATCTGGAITDNGAWLTLDESTIADDDAATGGVQTTVTATVDITGLTASGSPYSATITIDPTDTQPNPNEPCDSNLTVAVTLTISPGDATAPDNGSVVIDDGATWTNDSGGNVSVDISAHDAVGVSRYRLATSQAGLGSATDVAVSPAEVSFARSNLSFALSAGEGASKAVWARFCDAANNCTDASDTIGWDKTAPTITDAGVQSGTVGLNGWYTSAVVNRFQVSEGLSGLDAACQAAFPSGNRDVSSGVSQGASVTVGSGPCADLAGNTNAGILSAPFKIDSVAPSLVLNPAADSCSLPGNSGWCRGTQTAGFTASDATSGIAPSGTSPVDFTQSTATNGLSVNIASGPVSDMAGNSIASINAGPYKIDSVHPSVVLDATANSCSLSGNNGWCRGTQTAGFTASDATSGVAPGGASSVNFTQSTTTNGAAVSIPSGVVSDVAGNSTASVNAGPFKIDSVAPDVVLNAAANSCSLPGNNGWCRGTQTAGFTASDGTSGLANDGASTRNFTKMTTTNGGAVNIASGAVSDMAGNSNAGINAGPFKIDSVAPSVACPSPGPAFVLNQPNAQVSATVSDETSQPVNATELGNADTTSPGPKTVTITGEDNAGNTGSAACAYTVGFNFAGLFAPIDRPDTMNVSKAGQTIPLKWRLTDYFGDPVTNLTSVTVKVSSISCTYGSGTPDEVEEYAAGASGLQNLGDGYYQFNWKTPTSYAGSCKQLNLDLGEGTVRTNLALISFKK